MNKVAKKAKAARSTTITSVDQLRVKVTYAEPSKEAEQYLDEAVERIYRFGLSKGYF